MILTRLKALGSALLLLMLLWAPRALAHEFTLEAVVNAFVKVESTEVHLVVRAPLYLFKDVRFPIKGVEVDAANSAAAMERALLSLQNGLGVVEDGRLLKATSAAGRLALPSDRSFESYEQAVAHVASPVEPDTRIVVDQGYVDAHLVYPATSAASAVYGLRSAIAPELGDYLKLSVRFIALDGDTASLVMRRSQGTVHLNPSRAQAAASFIEMGIEHIVTGFDHLLFLLCLIVPVRGWRPVLVIVTGFTLGHSMTLIGSALGLVPQGAWFSPLVEMCIALSIVYTALENIMGVKLTRRVLLSVLFGLVHGFGFAYGLQQQLQFAGSHLLVSLLAFNIGIEIGQLMALAVMLPVLMLVTRFVFTGHEGQIILSAVLAHVGARWVEDRWEALSQVPWPRPGMGNLLELLLWAAGIAVLATVVRAAAGRLLLEPQARSRPATSPGGE